MTNHLDREALLVAGIRVLLCSDSSHAVIQMNDIVSHGLEMVAGYLIRNKLFIAQLSTAQMSHICANLDGQRIHRALTPPAPPIDTPPPPR